MKDFLQRAGQGKLRKQPRQIKEAYGMPDEIEAQVKTAIDNYITEHGDSFEIYVDYRDELEDSTIKKIFESTKPLDAFYEIIGDFDWWESASYEYDYILKEKLELSEEIKEEYATEISDMLQDYVSYEIPYSHFDETVGFDVYMHDANSANREYYDMLVFTETDEQDEDGDYIKELSEINGMLTKFLATQRYTAEQFIEYYNANKSGDSFLDSLIEEIKNTSYGDGRGYQIAFLVQAPITDMAEVIQNGGTITIPKTAMCGLVESFHGGGSLLDIKLKQDITGTTKEKGKAVYQAGGDFEIFYQHGYRYNIDDIYGLVASAWDADVRFGSNESLDEISDKKISKALRVAARRDDEKATKNFRGIQDKWSKLTKKGLTKGYVSKNESKINEGASNWEQYDGGLVLADRYIRLVTPIDIEGADLDLVALIFQNKKDAEFKFGYELSVETGADTTLISKGSSDYLTEIIDLCLEAIKEFDEKNNTDVIYNVKPLEPSKSDMAFLRESINESKINEISDKTAFKANKQRAKNWRDSGYARGKELTKLNKSDKLMDKRTARKGVSTEQAIDNLVNIGFDKLSAYKPHVAKSAKGVMNRAVDKGLAVPHDFGRGKGKYRTNLHQDDVALGLIDDEETRNIANRYLKKQQRNENMNIKEAILKSERMITKGRVNEYLSGVEFNFYNGDSVRWSAHLSRKDAEYFGVPLDLISKEELIFGAPKIAIWVGDEYFETIENPGVIATDKFSILQGDDGEHWPKIYGNDEVFYPMSHSDIIEIEIILSHADDEDEIFNAKFIPNDRFKKMLKKAELALMTDDYEESLNEISDRTRNRAYATRDKRAKEAIAKQNRYNNHRFNMYNPEFKDIRTEDDAIKQIHQPAWKEVDRRNKNIKRESNPNAYKDRVRKGAISLGKDKKVNENSAKKAIDLYKKHGMLFLDDAEGKKAYRDLLNAGYTMKKNSAGDVARCIELDRMNK